MCVLNEDEVHADCSHSRGVCSSRRFLGECLVNKPTENKKVLIEGCFVLEVRESKNETLRNVKDFLLRRRRANRLCKGKHYPRAVISARIGWIDQFNYKELHKMNDRWLRTDYVESSRNQRLFETSPKVSANQVIYFCYDDRHTRSSWRFSMVAKRRWGETGN